VPVIIFPLREKLRQNVLFSQQRPRSTGGRRVITLPTIPWDDADRPPVIGFGQVDLPPILAANIWPGYGLCAALVQAFPLNAFKQPPYLQSFSEQRFEPAVVHSLRPFPVRFFTITGVTRSSTGVALGTCRVELFFTLTDVQADWTTSDASGNFTFKSAQVGKTYYIVAYKAGSPDVFGTSLNTLTGV
jgi:hypothetical protein